MVLYHQALILAGILAFELLNRVIATRKPQDTEKTQAVRPWYGRDAVAAHHRRPALIQIAVPLGLGVGIVLLTSHGTFTEACSHFALGLGLGALREIVLWYIAPLLFFARDPSAPSLPNRLFPLEQYRTQEHVSQCFERWDEMPTLLAAQCKDRPVVPPIAPPPERFVISDEMRRALEENLAKTANTCRFQVGENDDLEEILTATGVTREEITLLNHGRFNWKPGAFVILPRKACLYIVDKAQKQQRS